MDINDLMTIIGNYGFPMVCCAALFWRSIKQDERHQEEMTKITEALNNNTIAITKLTEGINYGRD